jgi:hypothetical protein
VQLGDGGRPYLLCAVLFVALEVAALGCGVIGRHTSAGKAGMLVASLSLLLGLAAAGFLTPVAVRVQSPARKAAP